MSTNDPRWQQPAEDAPRQPSSEQPWAPAPAADAEGAATSRRALREQESRRGRKGRGRGTRGSDRPRRRRRWPWVVLAMVLVLGVAGAGAGYVWVNHEQQVREALGLPLDNDYEGTGNGEEVEFTVADGDIGEDVARNLVDAGITRSFDAVYSLLLTMDPAPSFYPGTYGMQLEMSAQSAVDLLLDPANRATSTVLIREGLTAATIYEEIAEQTGAPLDDVQAAAVPADLGLPADLTNLDGYLFPATYSFDPGTDPAVMLQAMVNRMLSALDERGVAPEDRHRVLTIASIVEREARMADDFPRVARVIENRLAIGMPLQMDSTAQYGVQDESGSVFSSDDQLTDDNPWNTYVIQGLPVGPISAPGDAAIDAVLTPADGDWTYFVTVDLETGETVFTTSLEDHDAAVQQLRDWCSANSDYPAC